MNILGISAFYHDSAACLVRDGVVLAAAQEERFSRIKNDSGFPVEAIKYCLLEAGILAREIDVVVFHEKPFEKFDRLLETWFAMAPYGFRHFRNAFPLWIKEKLDHRALLSRHLESIGEDRRFWAGRIRFSAHHLSHAASAFFPSPFECAAILTVDGVGEWSTATIAAGERGLITVKKEMRFPHSLGLLYSAFTEYLGFEVNSGEYKLMGLAPLGNPVYTDLIRSNLVSINEDGSFRLSVKYFDFLVGRRMTNARFHRLFGRLPRSPDSVIESFHQDIAASIQAVLEDILLRMARHASDITGFGNLCMAGGVALNCVANGKILRSGIFEDVWVQPAADDAGGALGAALAYFHAKFPDQAGLGTGRGSTAMKDPFLGPSYSNVEIARQLDIAGARYEQMSEDELLDYVAGQLADNRIIGWFQGRMEFGPRALGGRSILASPLAPEMKDRINKQVKMRESFRPFAPVVMEEKAYEWFDMEKPAPYMTFTVYDKGGTISSGGAARLPAVVHVDGSSRVQTLSRSQCPRLHKLLSRFENLTGCPVLLNTSYNVKGEPMVGTPTEAYFRMLESGLDCAVIGDFLVRRPL